MRVRAKYVSQRNNHTWSECLPMALATIRPAPHEALAGLSHFKALYGRKPYSWLDINLPAQLRASVSAHKYNRQFQAKIEKCVNLSIMYKGGEKFA